MMTTTTTGAGMTCGCWDLVVSGSTAYCGQKPGYDRHAPQPRRIRIG